MPAPSKSDSDGHVAEVGVVAGVEALAGHLEDIVGQKAAEGVVVLVDVRPSALAQHDALAHRHAVGARGHRADAGPRRWQVAAALEAVTYTDKNS